MGAAEREVRKGDAEEVCEVSARATNLRSLLGSRNQTDII